MPRFYLRFRSRFGTRADDAGFEFADLEEAYLSTCATIPEAAQEVLLKGEDPLSCTYVIADAQGRSLMEVPFTEVLPRNLWRRDKAPWRPAEGFRSDRTREALARTIFEQTLSASPIPHALVSTEGNLLMLNKAGFDMTGEDPDRVLGQCVFETFEGYKGPMSRKLEEFYALATRGLSSSVTNLHYRLPNPEGGELTFWSRALAWPVFDDQGRVLAVINCAAAAARPWTNGQCKVEVGHG